MSSFSLKVIVKQRVDCDADTVNQVIFAAIIFLLFRLHGHFPGNLFSRTAELYKSRTKTVSLLGHYRSDLFLRILLSRENPENK